MRRTVRILIVAVAAGGLVFLFVLPGRTWFQQRSTMATAQHRISVLDKENAVLAKRVQQLRDPAFVEQIARQQYGLVMPGEKAYGIVLPAATTTTTTVAPRR